jgi:hypothetical protein
MKKAGKGEEKKKKRWGGSGRQHVQLDKKCTMVFSFCSRYSVHTGEKEFNF